MFASIQFSFRSNATLPNKEQDGKKFLISWRNGANYSVVMWGAERGQFYDSWGDYVSNDTPFLYAPLPTNLTVTGK